MSPKRWLRRTIQNLRLRLRWSSAKKKPAAPKGGKGGLADCGVFYINLDRREDRRAHIEAELARFGIAGARRFSAIANENGALGCALSHCGLLRMALGADAPLTLVFEDDCTFLADRDRLDGLIEEFAHDDRLDVLCLAYNAGNGVAISENLAITSGALTMACYVAKRRILPQLIAVAAQSIQRLESGEARKTAAIDVVWLTLQKTAFFAIPRMRAARQIESFSDIERKTVDYRV